MTDIFKTWQDLEKKIDQQDRLDVNDFLENQGYGKSQVSESIKDASQDLLQHTFNPELLPKNTQLSKYKIIRQINSGGQSEIYLAERSDGIYKKTVVIKFIAHRYSFDTLRQQFLQEMQMLADLNHPGIVQILDGGLTDEDQPWLVLEYIEGNHIDEYCQDANLSHQQIVKLFITLCEALNFMHQRGVIHRDIKASNILINTNNNIHYPVIIDFGISSFEESEKSETTQSGDIFGTAGYSAPEQLAQDKTDNRADIFSLCMLLAQLLSKNDVLNIGLESVSTRIDILTKQNVSKDLIQIIKKATHSDPKDRYSNIEDLSLDLNNYLHQLPLVANQNKFGHILIKSFKRHKLAFFVAALILFSAFGFTVKYTSDIAQLQHLTAIEKNASDELYNFMVTDLFSNLSQIGRTDILKLVTEKSLEHLDNQNSLTLDAKTHWQRAKAYTNAGKVYDSLELLDKAFNAYDEGLKSLSFIQENPDYTKSYLKQAAIIKNLKSLTLTAEGQQKLTESNLLESLELSDQLLLQYPSENLDEKYESHTQLGWYYMEYNEPEKAITQINAAIETAKKMNSRQLDYNWIFNLSQAYQVMAWYQFDYGDSNKAVPLLISAIDLANRTVIEDGNSIRFFFNQTTLYNQLSYFYLESNNLKKAKETIERSIIIGKELQQKAPKNLDYRLELAYSYTTAAQISEKQNNLSLALDYYNQSLKITQLFYQNDNANFGTANDYAYDLIHIGSIYEKLSQPKDAERLWRQAVNIIKPVQILEPNNKYYTINYASALLYLGDYQNAQPLITELKETGFNDSDFENLLKQHKRELCITLEHCEEK
jgi:serine/threonine protein kinase